MASSTRGRSASLTGSARRARRGAARACTRDESIAEDLDRQIVIRQSHVPMPERSHVRFGWPGKLLAVADGFAGVSEAASTATLDGVLDYIASAIPCIAAPDEPIVGEGGNARILDNLKQVLVRCEHRLRRLSARSGVNASSPGAIALAYIAWPDLYVVHSLAGRCYLFRDGQLRRMASAQRVNVYHMSLRRGDRILLCTSSLIHSLDDAEIARCLGAELPATTVCDRLVATAERLGGADGITAVVCRCD